MSEVNMHIARPGSTMSQDEQCSHTQTPPAGTINLDHLAYFVPDKEACSTALRALGFASTPFSLQYHRLVPDAPLVEAGTGNHCVMLREGYLEFLVPLAETPVAATLRSALERYVGVHSIVFGSADAGEDRARLAQGGFAPQPVIDLQRTVGTAAGEGVARFSVVRVAPQTMAEGRIQYCQHHTQDLVWQQRWLDHPNAAVGLRSVFVAVEDLDEAVERYHRFTGIAASAEQDVRRIATHRGQIELCTPAALEARFGLRAPALPWIAGCELASSDMALTQRALVHGGLETRWVGDRRLLVHAPPAIGGAFLFVHA